MKRRRRNALFSAHPAITRRYPKSTLERRGRRERRAARSSSPSGIKIIPDDDIVSALRNLGYPKGVAQRAARGASGSSFDARFRAALNQLGRNPRMAKVIKRGDRVRAFDGSTGVVRRRHGTTLWVMPDGGNNVQSWHVTKVAKVSKKKNSRRKRRTPAQKRAFRKMIAALKKKQRKKKNRGKPARKANRRRSSPRRKKRSARRPKELRISNPNVAAQVKKALKKLGYRAKIITGKLRK